MSSSPVVEPSSPSTTPSSPALRIDSGHFQTSTPNFIGRKQAPQPLSVILPSVAPTTLPIYGEPTLTPPPRSPGAATSPASGDRTHQPDGTSSDKSSETAVGVSRTPSTALSRKESYKAQRQHYRREKKRAASALLHSIEDPAVVVLADWLKVRGSLKSWTKLWCVLKPGLLLLYKSPKAKSSHWVGTVLLTSCQVIERPSKKDGFCFKLYHPLEQSIWAPRGPHNETIGAVVQPLPTAHLIFRAPSQAAGHCWLDGLELALRCSNAMLRCSRAAPELLVAAEAPVSDTNISHEELEKHFNEHVLKVSELSSCSSPLMSVLDYDSKTNQPKIKPRKTTKWAQFIESIEMMSKYNEGSSDTESEKRDSVLDFLRKKETVVCHDAPSLKGRRLSKSLVSSPYKMEVFKSPLFKCFDIIGDKAEKLSIEDNLVKLMGNLPKRRSSTPTIAKPFFAQRRISELRESGIKSDSENDDALKCLGKRRAVRRSEVICDTPDNILITKTAPSVEKFKNYSSSSDEEYEFRKSPTFHQLSTLTPDKYSVIDYKNLPSASFAANREEMRGDRLSSSTGHVAGTIVTNG